MKEIIFSMTTLFEIYLLALKIGHNGGGEVIIWSLVVEGSKAEYPHDIWSFPTDRSGIMIFSISAVKLIFS